MYTIYALEDQRRTGVRAVRYIGITDNVYTRFQQHLRSDRGNEEKDAWIRDLKDAQVMLVMRTLETVETQEEALQREQAWIQEYLSQGAKLLNVDIRPAFSFDDFTRAMNSFKLSEKPPVREKKKSPPKKIRRVLSLKEPIDITIRRKPLTVTEVAAILQCTERQVRSLRAQGKLLTDDSDKRLIRVASVRAYMASLSGNVSWMPEAREEA